MESDKILSLNLEKIIKLKVVSLKIKIQKQIFVSSISIASMAQDYNVCSLLLSLTIRRKNHRFRLSFFFI